MSPQIRFVSNMQSEATADVVYRMCPMHLMKAQEKIREMEPGQVLEILTDYDGALDDIPAWCERTGNEFLGVEATDEDIYRLYVKKLH